MKRYSRNYKSEVRDEYTKQERIHLNNLFELLNKNEKGIKFNFTPTTGMCHYDGVLEIIKLNEKPFYVIVEAKVRTKHWNEYFLQVDKYHFLKDALKFIPSKQIWYVNFSPNGTFIFDLLKTDLGKPERIEMNRRTFQSKESKVPKAVFKLDCTNASYVNYKVTSNV